MLPILFFMSSEEFDMHLHVSLSFKGIDRSFELRGEIRLIRSVMTNWRLGNFFSSHFKWPSSQDQQKTNSCRLITFKVTLTGQSHFMLIFWLRKVKLRGHTVQYSTVQYSTVDRDQLLKVTLRNYINSVQWMYAITPTPYNECTQFVDSVKSLSFS